MIKTGKIPKPPKSFLGKNYISLVCIKAEATTTSTLPRTWELKGSEGLPIYVYFFSCFIMILLDSVYNEGSGHEIM